MNNNHIILFGMNLKHFKCVKNFFFFLEISFASTEFSKFEYKNVVIAATEKGIICKILETIFEKQQITK